MANLIPQANKSPLTDDQFRNLKQIAANHKNTMDTIRRLEISGAYTPEQIADLKQRADDTYNKVTGVIKAFQDLHPGI